MDHQLIVYNNISSTITDNHARGQRESSFLTVASDQAEEDLHFQQGSSFLCDICGNDYQREDVRDKHKRIIHEESTSWLTEDGQIRCEFCGLTNKLLYHFLRHQRTEHGFDPEKKTLRWADCKMPSCYRKFTSTSRLKVHTATMHPDGPGDCIQYLLNTRLILNSPVSSPIKIFGEGGSEFLKKRSIHVHFCFAKIYLCHI